MASYVIELCLGVNNEKLLLTETDKGFNSTTKQRSAAQYRTRDMALSIQEQLMTLLPAKMRTLIRKESTHMAPVSVSIKSVKDSVNSRSRLYTFINQE